MSAAGLVLTDWSGTWPVEAGPRGTGAKPREAVAAKIGHRADLQPRGRCWVSACLGDRLRDEQCPGVRNMVRHRLPGRCDVAG